MKNKITSADIASFKDYVKSFYGLGGIYEDTFKPAGATDQEIDAAIEQYIQSLGDHTWGGGDSIDRERVRDLMLQALGFEVPVYKTGGDILINGDSSELIKKQFLDEIKSLKGQIEYCDDAIESGYSDYSAKKEYRKVKQDCEKRLEEVQQHVKKVFGIDTYKDKDGGGIDNKTNPVWDFNKNSNLSTNHNGHEYEIVADDYKPDGNFSYDLLKDGVKVKSGGIVDLKNFVKNASSKEFKTGGDIDDYKKNLSMVEVIFINPEYNYKTNLSGTTTEEEARKYFVGQTFNVGRYPKEQFAKVIDIKFHPKGTYENGGNVLESNGTKYFTHLFEAKGNKWQVMFVSGKLNYIMVRKLTNNPFGGPLGKEFKNIDEAIAYYKIPEMKAQLIYAEKEAQKNGLNTVYKHGGDISKKYTGWIAKDGNNKFHPLQKGNTVAVKSLQNSIGVVSYIDEKGNVYLEGISGNFKGNDLIWLTEEPSKPVDPLHNISQIDVGFKNGGYVGPHDEASKLFIEKYKKDLLGKKVLVDDVERTITAVKLADHPQVGVIIEADSSGIEPKDGESGDGYWFDLLPEKQTAFLTGDIIDDTDNGDKWELETPFKTWVINWNIPQKGEDDIEGEDEIIAETEREAEYILRQKRKHPRLEIYTIDWYKQGGKVGNGLAVGDLVSTNMGYGKIEQDNGTSFDIRVWDPVRKVYYLKRMPKDQSGIEFVPLKKNTGYDNTGNKINVKSLFTYGMIETHQTNDLRPSGKPERVHFSDLKLTGSTFKTKSGETWIVNGYSPYKDYDMGHFTKIDPSGKKETIDKQLQQVADYLTKESAVQIMEQGGSIDSNRRFTEVEFNRLTMDTNFSVWYDRGFSTWLIAHKDTGTKTIGKFNPINKTLFIAGAKDLSNPLVKWLQQNSGVSVDEYAKLEEGGNINDIMLGKNDSEIVKNIVNIIKEFATGAKNTYTFNIETPSASVINFKIETTIQSISISFERGNTFVRLQGFDNNRQYSDRIKTSSFEAIRKWLKQYKPLTSFTGISENDINNILVDLKLSTTLSLKQKHDKLEYKDGGDINSEKPITLIISSKAPLSNQLQALTGKSYNDNDFTGSTKMGEILTEIETGKKFTIVNTEEANKHNIKGIQIPSESAIHEFFESISENGERNTIQHYLNSNLLTEATVTSLLSGYGTGATPKSKQDLMVKLAKFQFKNNKYEDGGDISPSDFETEFQNFKAYFPQYFVDMDHRHSQDAEARGLSFLDQIYKACQTNPEAKSRMHQWLKNGDTLLLRDDILKKYTDYRRDAFTSNAPEALLDFNAFASLDSAGLHYHEKQKFKNGGNVNGIKDVLEKVKLKYPKAVRNYGITEAFIDPYGEFRMTSQHDIPFETAQEIEQWATWTYEDYAKLFIGINDTVIVNAGRFTNQEAKVIDMGIGGNNYKVKFADGTKAIIFPDQLKKKFAADGKVKKEFKSGGLVGDHSKIIHEILKFSKDIYRNYYEHEEEFCEAIAKKFKGEVEQTGGLNYVALIRLDDNSVLGINREIAVLYQVKNGKDMNSSDIFNDDDAIDTGKSFDYLNEQFANGGKVKNIDVAKFNAWKNGPRYNTAITLLNEKDVDYTNWTDVDIYKWYLENEDSEFASGGKIKAGDLIVREGGDFATNRFFKLKTKEPGHFVIDQLNNRNQVKGTSNIPYNFDEQTIYRKANAEDIEDFNKNFLTDEFARGGKIKDIDQETDLLPEAMAQGIAEHAAQMVQDPAGNKWDTLTPDEKKQFDADYRNLTNKIADYLVLRANTTYKNNAQYRKMIKKNNNASLDYMQKFMKHWAGWWNEDWKGGNGVLLKSIDRYMADVKKSTLSGDEALDIAFKKRKKLEEGGDIDKDLEDFGGRDYLQKLYLDNEANNYHEANAVLLCDIYGVDEEKNRVSELVHKNNSGQYNEEDYKELMSIQNKYYQTLFEGKYSEKKSLGGILIAGAVGAAAILGGQKYLGKQKDPVPVVSSAKQPDHNEQLKRKYKGFEFPAVIKWTEKGDIRQHYKKMTGGKWVKIPKPEFEYYFVYSEDVVGKKYDRLQKDKKKSSNNNVEYHLVSDKPAVSTTPGKVSKLKQRMARKKK